MSQTTYELTPPVQAPPYVGRRGGRGLLTLTCLLVAAATIGQLRVEIGGLFVPLFVVPVLLAIPTIVLPAWPQFPRQTRTALLVFFILFAFSVLRYGEQFGDLIKMGSSVMTIIAVALMMRRRDDFVRGTQALCISLLVANFNGLRGGFVEYEGYRPLGDIANKNAYSLYALPVILFAGFMILHFRTGLWTRLLVAGTVVSTAFLLFSGGNRSGWGGMLLIATLLAVQTRRWRAVMVVGVLSLVSYATFTFLGTRQTFDYRIEQTRQGYASDQQRVGLFSTAMDIAIDNPLFGTTPQELNYELAKRMRSDLPQLDTHNFVGYIAAGSGFPTLLALLAVAIQLCRRPRRATPNMVAASDLTRMLCVLFVARGMFSRELFFVGPFPIALGLAIGLAIVSSREAKAVPPQAIPQNPEQAALLTTANPEAAGAAT